MTSPKALFGILKIKIKIAMNNLQRSRMSIILNKKVEFFFKLKKALEYFDKFLLQIILLKRKKFVTLNESLSF